MKKDSVTIMSYYKESVNNTVSIKQESVNNKKHLIKKLGKEEGRC